MTLADDAVSSEDTLRSAIMQAPLFELTPSPTHSLASPQDDPNIEIVDPESYRAARLVEPEWSGGFRGAVGKLLWHVHGLEKKAIRFVNCNKLGRPGVCSRYPLEHKYFVPNGCEVVFCKECADESRRILLNEYWHVVCNAVLDFAGERAGHQRLCELLANSVGLERETIQRELDELWARVGQQVREKKYVLARVTYTLRSDGSDITPERAKGMNTCVGLVSRRTVGSRKGYGMFSSMKLVSKNAATCQMRNVSRMD